MSYKEVKNTGVHYFENRKSNTDLLISEEDIKTIDTFGFRRFVYPVATFTSLLAGKYLMKYIPRPDLFTNPIEPEVRTVWRKLFFNKMLSNQIIFVCTLGSVLYTIVRYEFVKYYMYLKYENLVEAYLEAKDSEVIKSLSAFQMLQNDSEKKDVQK